MAAESKNARSRPPRPGCCPELSRKPVALHPIGVHSNPGCSCKGESAAREPDPIRKKKKRSLFRPHGGCCYRSRSAVMHRLCIAAQLSCHFDIAKPDRCARHSASSADFPSLACQPVVWKPPSIAFEGVCARARVVP